MTHEGKDRPSPNPAAYQAVGLLPLSGRSVGVSGDHAMARGICALPVLPISCASPGSVPCRALPASFARVILC